MYWPWKQGQTRKGYKPRSIQFVLCSRLRDQFVPICETFNNQLVCRFYSQSVFRGTLRLIILSQSHKKNIISFLISFSVDNYNIIPWTSLGKNTNTFFLAPIEYFDFHKGFVTKLILSNAFQHYLVFCTLRKSILFLQY